MRTAYVIAALGVGVIAAHPAAAARIDTHVVSQLACPVKVTKIVAVYGTAGAKYKPADYAQLNAEGTEKLWVYAVFDNEGDDVVTSFTFEVLLWDAAGSELAREEGVFDFPLRGDPKSKEWCWEFERAEATAAVVFIPRSINYPAGRKWENDEKFIDLKLAELREAP
jgi:hypothetical protein